MVRRAWWVRPGDLLQQLIGSVAVVRLGQQVAEGVIVGMGCEQGAQLGGEDARRAHPRDSAISETVPTASSDGQRTRSFMRRSLHGATGLSGRVQSVQIGRVGRTLCCHSAAIDGRGPVAFPSDGASDLHFFCSGGRI